MSSATKWKSSKDRKGLNGLAKQRLIERLRKDPAFFEFIAKNTHEKFSKEYYEILEVTPSVIRIKPNPTHIPELISHFEFMKVKINHERLAYYKNQWGDINRVTDRTKTEDGIWCTMDKRTGRRGYGWFANWADIEEIHCPIPTFVSLYNLDRLYLQKVQEENRYAENIFTHLSRNLNATFTLKKGLPIIIEKEGGNRQEALLPYDWTVGGKDLLQKVVQKGMAPEELVEEKAARQKAAKERSEIMGDFFSAPKEEDLSELLLDVVDYSEGLNNQYGISYIDAPKNHRLIGLKPIHKEKNGIIFVAVWIDKQALREYMLIKQSPNNP